MPNDRTRREHGVRIGGAAAPLEDFVAVEEPLEIRVLGRSIAVVMRTPGDDFDLAAGFVVTEGIVHFDDVSAVARCAGEGGAPAENIVNVSLAEGASLDWERFRRNMYVTSSCGICGKATLDAVEVAAGAVGGGNVKISRELLLGLPAACRGRQEVFDATGGLHAAALFDARGQLLLVREDVGRHNAVDKLAGALVRTQRYPATGLILFVTGRAGFEIIQKAWMAQVCAVAAVGAPSSLAVECARRAGLTLVGFLRERAFNVYNGAERIVM